jgi:hypothetical protein
VDLSDEGMKLMLRASWQEVVPFITSANGAEEEGWLEMPSDVPVILRDVDPDGGLGDYYFGTVISEQGVQKLIGEELWVELHRVQDLILGNNEFLEAHGGRTVFEERGAHAASRGTRCYASALTLQTGTSGYLEFSPLITSP